MELFNHRGFIERGSLSLRVQSACPRPVSLRTAETPGDSEGRDLTPRERGPDPA